MLNLASSTDTTDAEPEAPQAPLTFAQALEFTNDLRKYLAEIYPPPYCGPFKYTTFRPVWRTYHRDEAPRSAPAIGLRRSQGTHSDPTPYEAIANAEGVRMQVPEPAFLPWAAMRDLIASLPSHLSEPLQLAVINSGGTYYVAAQRLRSSQTTMFRRCDEALDRLGALIFGPRWPSATAPAVETALATMAVIAQR